MAFALIGYVTSMVTALVFLMMLLNSFLGSTEIYRPRPQHYPMPAIAQVREPEKTAGYAGDVDAATSKVAEDAIERLAAGTTGKMLNEAKLARDKKLRMLARQRDQQQTVAALGYGPEPSDGPFGPFFGPFGTRRN